MKEKERVIISIIKIDFRGELVAGLEKNVVELGSNIFTFTKKCGKLLVIRLN